MCSCNTGYYGSGCEYSFCGEQAVAAESGAVLDRSANSPFPLMTTRMCSWAITVPKGKQASVALQLLRDTQSDFAVFVLDGAFTQEQIELMDLDTVAPLVLASTLPVTLMNTIGTMFGLPDVMPVNCSNSLWATCNHPKPPTPPHLTSLPHMTVQQLNTLHELQPPLLVSLWSLRRIRSPWPSFRCLNPPLESPTFIFHSAQLVTAARVA